ncbi:MAG: hypothetical protein RJA49_612 [Actinomycetota bacterium]|jgi:hypothetical protein
MHIPRKVALAILASVSVAGMAGASAATLGVLNSGSVGSSDAIVAACDTAGGIGVNYTTAYNAGTQKYQVTAVNFTGVDAPCDTKVANVTLRNGAASIATIGPSTIGLTAGAFSVAVAPGVDVASLTGISLVISG